MGHPVVHFEIGCRDRAKTERFFADLFGWHIQQNGPASTIDTASRQGIPGHITSLSHEPHPLHDVLRGSGRCSDF
jgi:predicted enzyme related to lactoylglutathione lyase